MVWDITTDWIQKQMKIQPYSIKEMLKRFVKCETVCSFQVFVLGNIVIFKKKLKNTMGLLMFMWINKCIF